MGQAYQTETLDLNTGKYTAHLVWVGVISSDLITPAPCSGVVTIDITGTVESTLVPIGPPLSLGILNPYACVIHGNSCTAPPTPGAAPQPGDVSSAPPATAISADGQSAAVIMIQSHSSDSVVLDLSASPSTVGIGSLTQYDTAYLSESSPSAGTAGPVTISSTSPGSSCNPDPLYPSQMDCVFLALLWSPASMPGGGAVSSSGTYQSILLTITALQDSTTLQATISLQPPPLVLVHGLWSSAAEAWPPPSQPGFQQWLSKNYPHNLIFTADYGKYDYLAYSDPPIQNIMEGAVSNALATAASQGVVAEQVDVVGHSMGGLVTSYSRDTHPPPYPLSYLLSDPVHQLVTVGTPHLGSPLATILAENVPTLNVAAYTSPTVAGLCSALPVCTLGNLFALLGKPISTAVVSLEPGNQQFGSQTSNSIEGDAPDPSETGVLLNMLLGAFVPGSTVDGVLGTGNDTIVGGNSQYADATNTATINGIVHTSLCEGWSLLGVPLCADTGETRSPCVWAQSAYWLMGGNGKDTSVANCSIDPPNPVLDLTGYTQVAASNVTFSPATASALPINSATSITATSPTKTTTEILLFQTVSDPTDVLLMYSTQSPFSIAFTPTRMGSTTFTAFAVFSDMTYATTTLSYTFQLSGSPLALNLLNAPVASMPVGSSVIVGAQALFSNGPVDVSQAATYNVRSGTTTVFSVDSTGTVTANGPGTDWLDVSYSGLIASAQIAVGSCTYDLSPVNQLVDYSGGSVTIQVTASSNCAWTADTGGASWLTATNASGSGSGTITLTATPNTTGASQTAIIAVATQDVAVIQPAAACTYSVSQPQINVPASGASGSITVTTACPIVVSSNADWVVPVSLSGSVNYSVAPNTSSSQRTAIMTVGTQAVGITQAGLVGTTTSMISSVNPSVSGQSVTFTAKVTPASGTTVPTGTVTFFDGTTSLGTGTLNASGVATLGTSALGVGSHSITANYGGDSNFASSTSTVLTQVVNGPSVSVTIGTSPAGLSFTVDGTTYTSAQTLTWTIGTSHALTTTSSQTPTAGTQYTFASWSDSGAISHSVTASSGTTSYTASFTTSYQLTTAVSPTGGGTVSPGTGGYYASGMSVPLVATPNTGYVFSSWSGPVASASSASTTVTMSAPESVMANFQTSTVKDAPTIDWATPAAITYGTALTSKELDAKAVYNGSSVDGTFVYTPAKGAVLGAGSQTLSVTFTPTKATKYTTATGSVTLVVNQDILTVKWAKPAAIIYETPLSGTQLNARAVDPGGKAPPGTFVYSPAAGTVLDAGDHALAVTFTPNDTTDYTTPTDTVTLTVDKARSATAITSHTPNPSLVAQAVTVRFDVTGGGIGPKGSVTVTASTGETCSGVLSAGAGSCSLTFTTARSRTLTAKYAGILISRAVHRLGSRRQFKNSRQRGGVERKAWDSSSGMCCTKRRNAGQYRRWPCEECVLIEKRIFFNLPSETPVRIG